MCELGDLKKFYLDPHTGALDLSSGESGGHVVVNTALQVALSVAGGELPKLLVRENRGVNLFQFSLSPGFLAALKFIAELSHLAGASRIGFIPK